MMSCNLVAKGDVFPAALFTTDLWEKAIWAHLQRRDEQCVREHRVAARGSVTEWEQVAQSWRYVTVEGVQGDTRIRLWAFYCVRLHISISPFLRHVQSCSGLQSCWVELDGFQDTAYLKWHFDTLFWKGSTVLAFNLAGLGHVFLYLQGAPKRLIF